jgi:hypothetical protein
VILQVDRTNKNDVTFSLLDRSGNPQTFHLTSGTQFGQHQSPSQLNANMLASIKATTGPGGILNAISVQLQGGNRAALTVQGVVASIDQTLQTVTLALNDGTMLTIALPQAKIAQLQTGSTISVQAHFTNAGSLAASTYRVVAAHAAHFQARGIVSHINTRLHRLTLVSPSGASFSVAQGHTMATSSLDAKITISGSSDNQGNLQGQSVTTLDASGQSSLTVIGMVSAIDTTAGSFSLVDREGNTSAVQAGSDLLASLRTGGVYELAMTVASDGSITATQVLTVEGNDQGGTIPLQGTVQLYDATSGLLNIATDDGQSFTVQVNQQTVIVNSDATPGKLASGQAVRALLQLHADNSYTVLKIEILDGTGAGNQMTFAGLLLYYDDFNQKFTISIGIHQQGLFFVNSATTVVGASSMASIEDWSLLKVTAGVQADGSYLATVVEVIGGFGFDLRYHHAGRA